MSQDSESYIGQGHWWFCSSVVACMCICKRRVFFFEKYLRSNIRRFVRRKVHHISKTHFQGIQVVAG